jgi:hypothetical protein
MSSAKEPIDNASDDLIQITSGAAL